MICSHLMVCSGKETNRNETVDITVAVLTTQRKTHKQQGYVNTRCKDIVLNIDFYFISLYLLHFLCLYVYSNSDFRSGSSLLN